jgi:6-phosphogluconolactonase
MNNKIAYIGCRTTRERNARGEGLTVFSVTEGPTWMRRQVLAGLPNPSFLTLGRADVLYTVHGDHGEVTAHRVHADGELEVIGTQSTGGRNPVHLVVDGTGTGLIVANYATGTVARLPINPDGSLGAVMQLLALPGEPGPHRMQQKGSHPHQVLADPTGRRFVVPDKGLDRVFFVEVDEAGEMRLDGARTVHGREGAGPRHGAFHPAGDTLYVVNELDATVTTLRYDARSGEADPVEIVSTLPPRCLITSHAAGIVVTPCGRWVFVSNRGHDSITTFAVEPSARTLVPVAWTSAQGEKPRFITLDPDGHLLVANEDSDLIVTFEIDGNSGRLTPVGDPVRTGSPVCILFRASSGEAPGTDPIKSPSYHDA